MTFECITCEKHYSSRGSLKRHKETSLHKTRQRFFVGEYAPDGNTADETKLVRYDKSLPGESHKDDINACIHLSNSDCKVFSDTEAQNWEAIEATATTPGGMAVAHAALAISRVCQASRHDFNSAESYDALCNYAAFHYQAAIGFIDWSSTTTETLNAILACLPFLVVFLQLIDNDKEDIEELIRFSQMTCQELDRRQPGSDFGDLLHKLSTDDVQEYMNSTVKSYYIQMEEISNILRESL